MDDVLAGCLVYLDPGYGICDRVLKRGHQFRLFQAQRLRHPSPIRDETRDNRNVMSAWARKITRLTTVQLIGDRRQFKLQSCPWLYHGQPVSRVQTGQPVAEIVVTAVRSVGSHGLSQSVVVSPMNHCHSRQDRNPAPQFERLQSPPWRQPAETLHSWLNKPA